MEQTREKEYGESKHEQGSYKGEKGTKNGSPSKRDPLFTEDASFAPFLSPLAKLVAVFLASISHLLIVSSLN